MTYEVSDDITRILDNVNLSDDDINQLNEWFDLLNNDTYVLDSYEAASLMYEIRRSELHNLFSIGLINESIKFYEGIMPQTHADTKSESTLGSSIFVGILVYSVGFIIYWMFTTEWRPSCDSCKLREQKYNQIVEQCENNPKYTNQLEDCVYIKTRYL